MFCRHFKFEWPPPDHWQDPQVARSDWTTICWHHTPSSPPVTNRNHVCTLSSPRQFLLQLPRNRVHHGPTPSQTTWMPYVSSTAWWVVNRSLKWEPVRSRHWSDADLQDYACSPERLSSILAPGFAQMAWWLVGSRTQKWQKSVHCCLEKGWKGSHWSTHWTKWPVAFRNSLPLQIIYLPGVEFREWQLVDWNSSYTLCSFNLCYFSLIAQIGD